MPTAKMLMIVPEMIWSARTRDRQPRVDERDEHRRDDPRHQADEQGRRGAQEPGIAVDRLGGEGGGPPRDECGGEHHALDPDVDDARTARS